MKKRFDFECLPKTEIPKFRENTNVLFVTVTPVETLTFISKLEKLNSYNNIIEISADYQTYHLGRFGIYNVIQMECSMGTSTRDGALSSIQEAIDTWSPKAIIMVGIAFGKGGKQCIGDVLLSEKIAPYELARMGERRIQRGPIAQSSPILLNRFKNVVDWKFRLDKRKYAKAQFGTILSGDKLVDNLEYKTQLFELYPEAIGGEMEGAGLYAAASKKNIDWLLVKGICDWGDGTKSDNFQAIAAQAAIDLCHKVFSKQFIFEDIGVISADQDNEKKHQFFNALNKQFYEKSNDEIFIQPEIVRKSVDNNEYICIDDIIKDDNNYVVIAPSGMGKTILLNNIGKIILSDAENSGILNIIPIKIHIKLLLNHVGRPLESTIYEYSQIKLTKNEINGKRILWLLDGLDQLDPNTDFGYLNDILIGKSNYLTQYGNNFKIIVASRPTYERRLAECYNNSFNSIYLKPFDKDRIKRYLGNSYTDIYLNSSLKRKDELLGTPLLLNMTKKLFLKMGSNIDIVSRYSLYHSFIKELFNIEFDKKNYMDNKTEIINVFSEISFLSFEHGFIGQVSIEDLLCNTGLNLNDNVKDAIKSWCVIHDVIEVNDDNLFAYTHQSFQEYFASLKIYMDLKKFTHKKTSIEEVRDYIINHLEYFYWDEAWAFLLDRINDGMRFGDSTIKKEAASIGGLANTVANMIYNNLKEYPEVCAMALINFSPNHVVEIIQKMLDARRSWWSESIAVEFLWGINTGKSISMLKSVALSHEPHNYRMSRRMERAVLTLSYMHTIEASQTLLEIIRHYGDSVYGLYDMIATALGENRYKPAAEYYSEIASNKKYGDHEREIAIAELGNINLKSSLCLLSDILLDKNDNNTIRISAAETIGTIDFDYAKKILFNIIDDENEDDEIRYFSAKTIYDIDNSYDNPILSDYSGEKQLPQIRFVQSIFINGFYSIPQRREARDRTYEDEDELNPATLLSIIQEKAENRTKRITAIKKLEEEEISSNVEMLNSVLRDKTDSISVRWAVAKAVDYTQRKEAIPFLEEILREIFVNHNFDEFDIQYCLSELVSKNYLLDKSDFLREVFFKGGASAGLPRLIYSKLDGCDRLDIVKKYNELMFKEECFEHDQFFAHMIAFFMESDGRRYFDVLLGNKKI